MTAAAHDGDCSVSGPLQTVRKLHAWTPLLVPWRTDNGAREKNFRVVEENFWGAWPNTVIHHGSTIGPFNRAAAINGAYAAARHLGMLKSTDVVVIADADSIVPQINLIKAILLAQEASQLTIAHDRWINVEVDEIPAFLDDPASVDPDRPGRLTYQRTVSSVIVVPTDLFEQVGGFDERFVGWGCEDMAFFKMCAYARGATGGARMVGGYQRIEGPVWHLAHERPEGDLRRHADAQYRRNRQLWREYAATRSMGGLERVRWPKGRP